MNNNDYQNNQFAINADRKKYQVIFINWFDRSADRILYETDENWERQLREEWIFDLLDRHGVELNVEDFIGKGVSIYFCQEIGVCGDDYDEDDGNLKVKRGEIDYEFWINDSSVDFPLIEGHFTPGIYWEKYQSIYYEMKELDDLSMLFSYFLDLILSVDEYKIVCHDYGAEMIALADNSIVRKVKRFPFNFFDVYCPFCRQAVHTHEIESENYPRCVQIDTPCSHYIDQVIKTDDKFHKKSLEEIGIIYKIDGDDLFIETALGWQKLTIYDPPYEPDKFFYSDNQRHYRDIFLFLET
jgi:hypothetical protein